MATESFANQVNPGVPGAPTGNLGVTVKLSIMMFLQFFLWGAWFVTLGPYMTAKGFAGSDIGNAYSMAQIAAILAPLFLGIIADRFFPSQVVMGVLHLIGGALLCVIPTLAGGVPAAGEAPSATLMVVVILAHMLCYMPTLGLSNTIAFNAMTNPEKQFPLVRVWGTIGWIVAGVLVAFLARQLVQEVDGASATETEKARAASSHFFYVAGASGILLGFFSFLLPHTPAPGKGKPAKLGSMLGLDALALLKDRNFAIFIICSLLICIPLAAYYSFAGVYAGATGVTDVPFKMTFGQMSEILFMLVMPLFFARLGVKWMLAVGMLAWVVRYGLFAGAWDSGAGQHITLFVLGGIILHGICYDFFFVTGQIYTERKAPAAIRAQAQGFLVLVTQGVGMLIGNQVFGRLVDAYTKPVPGSDPVVKATDWQTVWLIPTGFALLILFVFVALFSSKAAKPAADNQAGSA
ncbi:MAG: nucleoside permease [Planctomycetota bacterium]|nr:nucleoside permease [Planctomycetota bacterium]